MLLRHNDYYILIVVLYSGRCVIIIQITVKNFHYPTPDIKIIDAMSIEKDGMWLDKKCFISINVLRIFIY